ncbi:MAG: M1 family metallopeptidase [Flavobacteriales bacterium]|nr:M1 family metallopeptidase [Flavobacteriales bacterium]
MTRPSLVLLLTLAALFQTSRSNAQPNPFGCHFFHGQQAPMAPLNAGERSNILETIARSDTFDILNYDIHLDVTDYAGQRMVAHTTITYKALQDNVTHITFDLIGLSVDSVIGVDGPLAFEHADGLLRVTLANPTSANEEAEMTVYYQGNPVRDPQWGGFYFASGYIYNLGIGISTIPPHFGKVWYPCFDSFVERATYGYHVKSAGTYRLHGQGTFLGEQQLAGDTVIRSYAFNQPIPTHISAVAIADYAVHAYTHSGAYGDIPVTLAAKPANLNAMMARFLDLGTAIDVCEHWYGPYGFERVGYVLTTDGALEIPTNVAYPQFMTGQPVSSNRGLYSHELGHHWWGDVVTPDIHNNMWLKEGPAEYTGHLVEEWIDGAAGLQKAVKDNLLYVLRQAHVNDDGFQALSPMPDAHIYGTHTYYKGAAVMHNLRGYLGDELFREAMHTLQQLNAYTTISPEGFRDALEAATGTDLDDFFNAWVFAPGYSVFEVREHSAQQDGNNWNVALTIGQKLRGTSEMHLNVPLDLTFISATGETHDQRIVCSGALTDLNVNSPFEPAMVILNRHARLNQARLDHEVTAIPGVSLVSTLPYVDFRLYQEALTDTTLVRIEHLWAPPDQGPLETEILQISNTHYWTVDGLWPEGTTLRGRIYYYGANSNQLDHGLIAGNEAGISIVYRATPNEPWQVYPEQVVTAGNLTNGSGYIDANNLRKGQYTLAKSSAIVGISDAEAPNPADIELYPVPASQHLTVSGDSEVPCTVILDVIGTDGRIMQRSVANAQGAFQAQVDVSGLATGPYLMRATSTDGRALGTRRFEVVR